MKLLVLLVIITILSILSIVSAFVLNVSVEIKHVLIFIDILDLLLLGIVFSIFQLNKITQNNINEYMEYAKAIIGGVVAGFIVSVLTELKLTNFFSIEGAFGYIFILLLIVFVLAVFAPIFVFVGKIRNRKNKTKKPIALTRKSQEENICQKHMLKQAL